jgi:hypothetical protein
VAWLAAAGAFDCFPPADRGGEVPERSNEMRLALSTLIPERTKNQDFYGFPAVR